MTYKSNFELFFLDELFIMFQTFLRKNHLKTQINLILSIKTGCIIIFQKLNI
jgi:hypothetical protein